jgi:hypothetical protein
MRMRREMLLACGAALLAASGVPRTALAFCRTTTVRAPDGYDPAATDQCWAAGLPVYWANACVSYDLQQDAGTGIDYGEALAALQTAFALWTQAPCPGADGATASIQVSSLGPVSCGLVEYNECGPNQHVITFVDTWDDDDAANALALTTVSFDNDTGELYDADMQINATVSLSLATPVPEEAYDFASIVTHETGHFLGLAHAKLTTATMYAYLSPGQERRSLSDDDVKGLCTIYPPNGTRAVVTDAGAGVIDASVCDPTPRHGFTTACMPTPVDGGVACEPPPSSCGCRLAGRGSNGLRWSWVAGLAGALAIRRKTRGHA